MHQPTNKTLFKRYDTPLQDGNRGAEFFQETVTTHVDIDTDTEVVTARNQQALWGVTKESLIQGLKDNIAKLDEEHKKAVAEVQTKIDEIELL